MVKYLISDIEYDDGHDELPKMLTMDADNEMSEDVLEHEVSEFISNQTGYCHLGFSVSVLHNIG